jgi:hypothetical protein
MKKLPILMLSLFAFHANAQKHLGSLNKHQASLKNPDSSSSSNISRSIPVVDSPTESISSAINCEENDQTSLPLAYLTSLIQHPTNKDLDIVPDQRSGTLTVSAAADLIGNCNSMLQWKIKHLEIQGEKVHALEVQFKDGENCTPEGCTYNVAIAEKQEFKEHKPMVFKPTLKGFEECLEKSGAIVDGDVVEGAKYPRPLNLLPFTGLEHSGKILFLSHGPASTMVKPKYGKFEHIVGCDHYEAAHPVIKKFQTYDDAERERLDAEAARLQECSVDDYHLLSDFIEKNEQYAGFLGEIKDKLTIQAAAKAAEAILNGTYTDKDLKLISDFEDDVVNPKIELAYALYDEMTDLEGDAKKAVQQELKNVLAEISDLYKSPFTGAHTLKLLADGKFEDAEKLNSLLLVLQHNQGIGTRVQSVDITPTIAAQRVTAARAEFSTGLVQVKEDQQYSTGQESGKAKLYADLVQETNYKIQLRTENFTREIHLENMRRQQPNGDCYKYYVAGGTHKCLQNSQLRSQELTEFMQQNNQADADLAVKYTDLARKYADLEAKGRRYIAAQNGEPIPEEESTTPEIDTLSPAPRPQNDPGVYTFDFQGGNPQHGQPAQQYPHQPYQFPQQPQMMPQQHLNPMNPYVYQNIFQQPQNPWMRPQQYQNPWLGQHAYGMPSNYAMLAAQNSYNFNWNGGGMQNTYGQPQPQANPWMQQQQQGYWNQPHQAYNQYSMYGRSW